MVLHKLMIEIKNGCASAPRPIEISNATQIEHVFEPSVA